MFQIDGCILCARLVRAYTESSTEVLRLEGELRRAVAAGDESRVAALRTQSLAAERHRANAYEAARDHEVSVHARTAAVYF